MTTPMEADIARLNKTGKTYDEIVDKLFDIYGTTEDIVWEIMRYKHLINGGSQDTPAKH